MSVSEPTRPIRQWYGVDGRPHDYWVVEYCPDGTGSSKKVAGPFDVLTAAVECIKERLPEVK